jgi:hypothetical protein
MHATQSKAPAEHVINQPPKESAAHSHALDITMENNKVKIQGVLTDQGILRISALTQQIRNAFDAPELDDDPNTAMVFQIANRSYVGTIKVNDSISPAKGVKLSPGLKSLNVQAAILCLVSRQARRMQPEDISKLKKLRAVFEPDSAPQTTEPGAIK